MSNRCQAWTEANATCGLTELYVASTPSDRTMKIVCTSGWPSTASTAPGTDLNPPR